MMKKLSPAKIRFYTSRRPGLNAGMESRKRKIGSLFLTHKLVKGSRVPVNDGVAPHYGPVYIITRFLVCQVLDLRMKVAVKLLVAHMVGRASLGRIGAIRI
jgi:hypothetical protein